MATGRKTGGRQRGTLNRVAADVREAAQKFTTEAINTLAGIMADAEQPAAARVSAASAILDRGHGRPAQTISAAVDLRLKTAEEMSDAELALVALGGSGLG